MQSLLGEFTHSLLKHFQTPSDGQTGTPLNKLVPHQTWANWYPIKPGQTNWYPIKLSPQLPGLTRTSLSPPTRRCAPPARLGHAERGLAGVQCLLPARLLHLLHQHGLRALPLLPAAPAARAPLLPVAAAGHLPATAPRRGRVRQRVSAEGRPPGAPF